jgi:NTP pyrophosphatase (non-canonical NTP hydrolase)
MFTKDFITYIDDEDRHISKLYGDDDKRAKLLARTVKLAEETGEVSDAILSFLRDQRRDKLGTKHGSEIGKELADVVIVCALIAKTADIDISEALEIKAHKNKKRRERIIKEVF